MALRDWVRDWASRPAPGEGRLRSWLRSWLGGRAQEPNRPERENIYDLPAEFTGAPVAEPPPITDEPDTPMGAGDTPTQEVDPNVRTMLSGDWVMMSSSNVDEIRYLIEDKILEVRFLNNYFYQYYEVSPQTFLDFLADDSPGRFVWRVLRAGGYRYARIGGGVIPSIPTGNVRRVANVVRLLLPEEITPPAEAMRPGESMRKPPGIRLDVQRWPKLEATPAQIREIRRNPKR